MCGGRGTRMESGTEKPMTELAGRRFIERVVLALKESGRFEKIVAAVSPSTPATKRFLQSTGIETIDTPGAGYPQDLSILLEKVAPSRVLVVPADVPLLTAETVSEIVDKLAAAAVNAPAASIAIEKSFAEGLGVTPSVAFGNDLCHSGITLFDAARAKKGAVEERYVIMNRAEVALNVNTKREKEVAESLVKRANDLAGDARL
ncbi:NTP transferase domain-containing protein [Nitrososphaera viennensis]|uniref:NTP transferase domain-containing protein n=2 Tax=Nitrososphaera viennensis TaxID=1034015 RepID=A0A977IGP8_9ARCH|nr:NTP transferase domain-containing protein [Nitrososphaera viennensis]UVS70648.1 NTP transferase domain-containing protein [Nitrososphaera viennensis]